MSIDFELGMGIAVIKVNVKLSIFFEGSEEFGGIVDFDFVIVSNHDHRTIVLIIIVPTIFEKVEKSGFIVEDCVDIVVSGIVRYREVEFASHLLLFACWWFTIEIITNLLDLGNFSSLNSSEFAVFIKNSTAHEILELRAKRKMREDHISNYAVWLIEAGRTFFRQKRLITVKWQHSLHGRAKPGDSIYREHRWFGKDKILAMKLFNLSSSCSIQEQMMRFDCKMTVSVPSDLVPA